MYLRFQGRVPNEGSPSNLGIFQLAFDLRDRVDTPDYAYQVLQFHLNWLKVHLTSPAILDERENIRAICWFKPEARKPLLHIWPIKAMLEEFGYPIDVLKTRHPGWILYEDGWQVVARPDRRSQKIRRC